MKWQLRMKKTFEIEIINELSASVYNQGIKLCF